MDDLDLDPSTWKNVCLFCLALIPPGVEALTSLESVVPHGPDLVLRLDDPSKNRQSFDFLCGMLFIKWSNRRGTATAKFDRGQPLPLCLKCQSLYQEFYQLQCQIKELGRLTKERLGLITGIIKRSEEGRNKRGGGGGLGLTKLAYYGLEYFREKVISQRNQEGDDVAGSKGRSEDASATTPVLTNLDTTTTIQRKLEMETGADGIEDTNEFENYQILVSTEVGETIGVIPIKTESLVPVDHEIIIGADGVLWDEGGPFSAIFQSTVDDGGGEAPVEDDVDDHFIMLDSEYVGEEGDETDESDNDPPRPRVQTRSKESSTKKTFQPPSSIYDNDREEDDDNSIKSMEDEDDDDDEDYSMTRTRSQNGKKRLPKDSPTISATRSPKAKAPKMPRQLQQELRAPTSFTCHICDENITGRNDFLHHYADQHPEEKRYTCKICKQHFKGLWEVRLHQQRHTGVKPHECGYCPKRFTTKKSRNNHQKWIHEGTGKRFPCKTCGKKFPTRTLLKTHGAVHNETVVFCKSCGKNYKSEYSFSKHNRENHAGKAECSEPVLNPTVKDLEAIGLGVEASTKIACHICWENIHGRINIKKHFDQFHDGHPPLKCAKCGKQFNYYKEVRKHVLRHIGHKNLQCDKCSKKFHTNTELKNHSVTHLSESEKPKYVCEICGMAYSAKSNLALHYKTHEGNRTRWVCEICGKSYSERKGYQHHKKSVHLKETPHKCSYCPKSFVGASELVKHIRTHTRQKPYQCPLCDKSFPYTNSRSRHVREVHYNQKGKNRDVRKKKESSSNTANLQNTETENISFENSNDKIDPSPEEPDKSANISAHNQSSSSSGQSPGSVA